MKKTAFLLLFSAFSMALQSQILPQPSFWFGSNFSSTSLADIDTLGQTVLLPFQGDNSTIFSDKINGYPAVRIDSAGGYFTFSTAKLTNKDRALFLTVFEPQSSDYQTEQGLWSLQNGKRKRFLTSLRAGDGTYTIYIHVDDMVLAHTVIKN
jgi:hypothetical protein